MRTVYVRFVRDVPRGTELLSHTTLPASAVPRTGDYIDVPGSDGTGWHSVVNKVSWFYTREQGVPLAREVDSVWVHVDPKPESK